MSRPTPRVLAGVLALAMAGGTAWLIHRQPEHLRVPAWVAVAAVGSIGLAGLCAIVQAGSHRAATRWLVCALLALMAAVPGWIALGPGPRPCTAVVSGWRALAPDLVCRGVFGFATVVLAACFVAAAYGAAAGARKPR